MTIGPVSYTVIAFPGNQFNGEDRPRGREAGGERHRAHPRPGLRGQGRAGRHHQPRVRPDGRAGPFSDIDGEVGGLVNIEDLDHVAANLPEGNSALVILWEDLWAVPLVEAMRESGGVLIDSARIPADLIEAALEDLTQALKS